MKTQRTKSNSKIASVVQDPDCKIELVHSGEDFFSRMLDLINSAKVEIHLQTYIFMNDSTGILLAEALKKSASRGVSVYLLLDRFGSSLPDVFIRDLISNGIHFRFFAPYFSINSIYFGRRLHHKIFLVDGCRAIVGGINIADKYRGNMDSRAWLDYAVQFDGSAAAALESLCRNIFYHQKSVRKHRSLFFQLNGSSIRTLQNDWLRKQNDISNMYLRNIRKAKSDIIIVGSYFIPGRKLTKALIRRSKMGVKVKLILAGVSDVPLIKRATSFLYKLFLRNSIELYEWNDSVLHGKAAVIDQHWSTIGSFNLNHLSSYASIEMNVEIESPDFSLHFSKHLEEVIMNCERIFSSDFQIKRTVFSVFLDWVCYRIVRVASIIITYMPQKRLFIRKRRKSWKHFIID